MLNFLENTFLLALGVLALTAPSFGQIPLQPDNLRSGGFYSNAQCSNAPPSLPSFPGSKQGSPEIGESAVIVAVSSPHRSESFEACRFIIDEIKHRLPIWKKEFYPDGSSDWVGCEGCRQGHQH